MGRNIVVGVAQRSTKPTLAETIADLEHATYDAKKKGVDLLLFPEAYLEPCQVMYERGSLTLIRAGGYPRTATFGSSVGNRSDHGGEMYLHYFNGCVDLGDTPRGAGEAWVKKTLPQPEDGSGSRRGDGTREKLEQLSTATGIFLVVGLVERAGGSLYCGVVYVDPARGCIGKRRKVMPTGTERIIWAQGQPSSLRAVKTKIKGIDVTLAAAICWENYMPLLRQALYSQNVNIFLAPTADARDTWLPLMQTISSEGRTFVLSSNQCQRYRHLPDWISNLREGSQPSEAPDPDGFVCRGGSCVVAPAGKVLQGPSWEKEDDLLVAEIDLDDCLRGRLSFDAAGSYSRNDAFKLSVEGLDLDPPA